MQTIEAKAILSAADKTGGVFASIAAKIRGMNAAASAANRSAMASGAAVAAAHRGNAGIAAKVGGMSDAALMAASRIAAPAAIAVGAGKAVKRFAEVDLAMKRIGITADASDEEVGKFQKTLRETASANALSFDSVKGGMESLIAGGMELGQANKVIGAVSKTAQASGSDVAEMATTVLSLSQNAEVGADKMQVALDSLAKAGKEGKFEFKDMARYLPSILPAAAAVGTKGVEGVQNMAAALQTMRLGAGTSEEAATNMQNVLSKMNSTETAKKFKKMGVDLESSMKKAKKEGKDALETFVDLTDTATKGDLSQLPKLFQDMQVQAGMRAMMMYRKEYDKFKASIKNSGGTIDKDLARVLDSPAAKMAQMAQSADRLVTSIGGGLVAAMNAASNAGSKLFGGEGKGGASGIMDKVSESIDRATEKGGLQNIFKDEISKARDENLQSESDALGKQIDFREKFLDREYARRPDLKRKLDPELARNRLRKFDIDAGKGAGSATEGGLFSDAEVAKWKHFLPPQIDRNAVWGDVPPLGTSNVPMPTRDPRKSSAMPAVQGLDMPAAAPSGPQEVKVESTVTGEVQGSIPVNISVDSSGLVSAVSEMKAQVSAALSSLGAAITSANRSSRMGNGPGSTGVSSPDARPNTGIGGQ